MLQDALARDSDSLPENTRLEADTNPGEQKLDGEDFNVINHEDVEDIDDEEDETEQAFYRPGLAGLLGGRMMQRGRKTPGEFDHLHPFTQVLSSSTVDACVKLEAETFPANERCSKEKVYYFALFVILVSAPKSLSLLCVFTSSTFQLVSLDIKQTAYPTTKLA